MPVSPLLVRHRAAGRPTTALSDLVGTATGSLATVGRRSAVVVASSGLIMSVLAAPAGAAPVTEKAPASSPAVDTSALTSSARAALQTAPVVTVAKDATWELSVPEVKVVADPPPPPEPVVVPVAETETAETAEAPAAATAAAPASASGSAVIDIASRYVGVPYLWGGTTPAGFDCSGFLAYVYAQVGVTLPRTSAAQATVGTAVPRSEAQPGDLIRSPGHISIYAGGNMQIDAPKPGASIQFREIWQSSPTFIRVT